MSGLRAKRKNISQTLHSLELRQKVNDAKAKLAVPKILPHFHANTEEDHIGDLREQLLEFRERRQEGVGKFGRNLRRGNYRPELENGRYRSEAQNERRQIDTSNAVSKLQRQQKFDVYMKRSDNLLRQHQSLDLKRHKPAHKWADKTGNSNPIASSPYRHSVHIDARNGHFRRRMSTIEEKIKNKTNKHTLDSVLERGKALVAQKEFLQALKLIQDYEKEAGKEDSDSQLFQVKATCYMQMKEYKLALELFEVISDSQENCNESVFLSSAICHSSLGNLSAALIQISKALFRYPKSQSCYILKAKLLYKSRAYKEALQAYSELSRLTGNRQIRLSMGDCCYKMQWFQQAIAHYKADLDTIDAHNFKYLLRAGHCLNQLGQHESALSMLARCISYYQRDLKENLTDECLMECYYLTSLIQYRLGNAQAAIMAAEELLLHDNLAYATKAVILGIVCYVKLRNFYGAMHLIERATKLSVQGRSISFYHIFCQGVIMAMKRRYKQAMQKLQSIRIEVDRAVDEFSLAIKRIYSMYTAYVYLCSGNYANAQQELQKQLERGVEPVESPGLNYNLCLCKGIQLFLEGRLKYAREQFELCLLHCSDKKEACLYIGITCIRLYFENNNTQDQAQLRDTVGRVLTTCVQHFQEASNNYAAQVYYHRALYNYWLQDWPAALSDMDEAIDKSEENYPKFFYLRAIILSFMQNYKQAINDASVAISLNEKDAKSFILRSRCLQIQGEANQAFLDLQSYIDIRPNDPCIHQYAGHLLFQNGAFDEAILAYSQSQKQHEDFELYLTRGKTYFLLGDFSKAAEDMRIAASMRPAVSQYDFDTKVIETISLLFTHQKDAHYADEIYISAARRCKSQLEALFQPGQTFGKIFKMTQFYNLRGCCNVYLGEQKAAGFDFSASIRLKQASFLAGEVDQEYEEEENEKKVFINQMRFNLALCLAIGGNHSEATTQLAKCEVQVEAKSHDAYLQLLSQLRGEMNASETTNYEDIFVLKNKLSKYLPQLLLPLPKGARRIRLCVPYPKVEPPEISPKFDEEVLKDVHVDAIEPKPEAPWILKEDNSIKFTEKMQVYSRLDLEDSSVSRAPRPNHIPADAHLIDSFSESSIDESSMRQRLKLDPKIEEKLKKLLKPNV